MADRKLSIAGAEQRNLHRLFVDMGDGTWAERVVSTSAAGAEAPIVSGQMVDPDGAALTVKSARRTASADGNIVANVATKKIRVLGLQVQHQNATDADVTVKFNDAGGAQIAGSPEYLFTKRAEGVVAMSPAGSFLFESTAGSGIDIDVSAAVTVSVHLVYVEV